MTMDMHRFQVAALSRTLEPALRHCIDRKTKPLGALGQLEALALQAGLVQGSARPLLRSPQVIVFAGDHGIAAEGVSAYPQEVTWQMVMNFLAEGAAVNVLARANGLDVCVVDAGVKHSFAPHPRLVDAKVAPGTANSAQGPAMTAVQCDLALDRGAALVRRAVEAGRNVLAFGEMGIANTSAATLLLHKLAGIPIAAATGRGTGVDDAGLRHKQTVLERAAARTGTLAPLQALAEYGGFEIAMMAGAMLAAAQAQVMILVDGFITGSAALVACALAPAARERMVFAHCSAEAGHRALLQHLQAEPLLDLGLRLGEGTGAVLAWPLLKSAVAMLNEMASFDSAQVSERS
jgi:nicotinate-nucleotide--dimethylbenzimidazole phosphoribosyltransferase